EELRIDLGEARNVIGVLAGRVVLEETIRLVDDGLDLLVAGRDRTTPLRRERDDGESRGEDGRGAQCAAQSVRQVLFLRIFVQVVSNARLNSRRYPMEVILPQQRAIDIFPTEQKACGR